VKKIIVIPARYASTRLPGKPLREIHGKPIIQWVYEKAMESKLKDQVVIATDDERIRDGALAFGAVVAMTSPDCRSGTDRCMEAPLQEKNADIIVNLQGDEPFIRPDMVDILFDVMVKERLDMATLCSPNINEEEYGNPNIVKVVLDRFGFALYFSRSPIPYLRGQGFKGSSKLLRTPSSKLKTVFISISAFTPFPVHSSKNMSPWEKASSKKQNPSNNSGFLKTAIKLRSC